MHIYIVLLTTVLAAKDIINRFRLYSTAEDLAAVAKLTIADSLGQAQSSLKPFLVPRISGTPGNQKVQDFIIETFTKLGWDIQTDSFTDATPVGPKEFTNIIVTKDARAQKRLTFAAHFDSKQFDGFEFIGATDSSVPCAILIDLAISLNKPLGQRMLTNDRFSTIQMIFFDGEEAFVEWGPTDSIYGARHLASKWANEMIQVADDPLNDMLYASGAGNRYISHLKQIEALVLLDLLGTENAAIPNTHPETAWLFDRLIDIQRRLVAAGLVSEKLQARVRNKNDRGIFRKPLSYLGPTHIQDDHVPFYDLGVPVCHLIPYPFPKVWHTKDDNANAISIPVIQDLALIFRVLLVEYFSLRAYIGK